MTVYLCFGKDDEGGVGWLVGWLAGSLSIPLGQGINYHIPWADLFMSIPITKLIINCVYRMLKLYYLHYRLKVRGKKPLQKAHLCWLLRMFWVFPIHRSVVYNSHHNYILPWNQVEGEWKLSTKTLHVSRICLTLDWLIESVRAWRHWKIVSFLYFHFPKQISNLSCISLFAFKKPSVFVTNPWLCIINEYIRRVYVFSV